MPQVTVKRGSYFRIHAMEQSLQAGSVRELGSYTNSQLCNIPPHGSGSLEKDEDYPLESGTYYFSDYDRAKCLAGRIVIVSVDDE